MSISKEWCNFQILVFCDRKRETELAILRNKIKKHTESKAHEIAQRIIVSKNQKDMEKHIEESHRKSIDATESIFRTAYYLAKNSRPFIDHESLIELQTLNGVNMGIILHSRNTSSKIIEHIAREMERRIVSSIVNSSAKLSVLIDESTTVSKKPVLIIYIRASLQDEPPIFIFLKLLELEGQTASSICDGLLTCLKASGFTEEYLQNNWVSLVSDGASVMLGKNSGVAKRLTELYPRIFTWHCMNHRLELSVNDAFADVSATNHFRAFLDSLYALYSQSPKNMLELSNISKDLEVQLLRIGRIMDIRWVASSFRTIRAVWTSFPSLHCHFTSALEKSGSTGQKMRGLAIKLASHEFVCELGLMYDVLQELSLLSLQLQERTMSLQRANHLVKRTIRILETFKDRPGEKYEEALNAKEEGVFKGVIIQSNKKHKSIDSKQFIQSLIDNMNRRLCVETPDTTEFLSDMKILDTTSWPTEPDIRYGEKEVRRLCARFNLDIQKTQTGIRDFIEDPTSIPDCLKRLRNCIHTFPCSTAECERGFSLMNLISTDLRARLLISNISNIMFINVNGPPLNQWNPESYVKSWLASHRSAVDTRSKQRLQNVNHISNNEKESLWKLL